jgi:hypothetical protein
VNRGFFGRRGRPVRYVCVEVIRGLHGQGYSFRAIARTTGIGYGTVRRAFHGLAPIGADEDAAAGGMPAARAMESGYGRKLAAAG